MKKIIFFVFCFISLSAFAQKVSTFDPMHMPRFEKYVNDYSHVLSSNALHTLNERAATYDKETSTQIVTTLFPHRNGNELIDIGVKAFNENGIGQKGYHNGLLLLIATEEKKLRIIVGYGLEESITDAESKYIVESIRPYINSGDFAKAINLFYDMAMEEIKKGGNIFSNQSTQGILDKYETSIANSDLWTVLAILFGIIMGFTVPFIKKKKITKFIKSFITGISTNFYKKSSHSRGVKFGKILILFLGYFVLGNIVFAIFSDTIDILYGVFSAFYFSFPLGILIALIPSNTFKNTGGKKNSGGGENNGSSLNSEISSRSNDSWESNSSSSNFSGGGGSTGGGGAGD